MMMRVLVGWSCVASLLGATASASDCVTPQWVPSPAIPVDVDLEDPRWRWQTAAALCASSDPACEEWRGLVFEWRSSLSDVHALLRSRPDCADTVSASDWGNEPWVVEWLVEGVEGLEARCADADTRACRALGRPIEAADERCVQEDPAACAERGDDADVAACEMGWFPACHGAALAMLERGDIERSIGWLEDACRGGVAAACYDRGRAAVDGLVEEADLTRWWRAACDQGHVLGCAAVAEVDQVSRRTNLQEARARVLTEATLAWEDTVSRANEWDDEGLRSLKAFQEAYEDATVTVGDEVVRVPVPEMEWVDDWIALYDTRRPGQMGYELHPGPLGVWEARQTTTSGKPREVELTRAYAVGAMEVSQGLWNALMGNNPVATPACEEAGVGDDLPVVCVSWSDAVEFANRLSRREGLEPAYVPIPTGGWRWDTSSAGYRLPTEAEWEAVARATERRSSLMVQSRRFPGGVGLRGLCRVGNLADRSAGRTYAGWNVHDCDDGVVRLAPVGSYEPNASGHYDLLGNVREWVWDRFAPWEREQVVNPLGPAAGKGRGVRGGAWSTAADYQDTGARSWSAEAYRGVDIGLRLARWVDGERKMSVKERETEKTNE